MLTVITGASGHIGINLVQSLKNRGRQIRALYNRNYSILSTLGIDTQAVDILNLDSLIAAFDGAVVVYHLAAHISILMDDWDVCRRHNIEGTNNVINACRLAGVKRLIYFSSIHALDPYPLDTVLDEGRALINSDKCPPYDRSKAEAEKLVRAAIKNGLDAIIINPTAVLGPNDYRPSLFGQALINMAMGKYPVLIEGGFNWVDVRDVVEGAIRAEEKSPAGSSYMLSGHYATVKEIAAIVARIVGKRAPVIYCPLSLARLCAPAVTATARITGARPLFTQASLNALICNRHISHARATKELGYNPRPLAVTLKDTLSWFRDHGYLNVAIMNEF